MPTFGLEEEVFVLEPDLPSLNSLYYLSKLLWKNPKLNYRLTASNFSRGPDVRQALMSGVEVATRVHDDPESLVDDLAERRRDLAAVADGLVAPIGHLITLSTPTNVCALQLHVGGVPDLEIAYANIAYFLPVLNLLTANSPFAGGEYFGQSFRMAHGYSIGGLKDDPYYRFQDLIITKRLGTIELRSPDPVWDLSRVKVLAGAVAAIAELKNMMPFKRNEYNRGRDNIAKTGYTDDLVPLYNELSRIADVPEHMLTKTASDEVKEFFEINGLPATYSALDNGYREGVFAARELPASKASALKSIAGLAGYYVPKFPYVAWKYLKEK
jgi:hypothetical protein